MGKRLTLAKYRHRGKIAEFIALVLFSVWIGTVSVALAWVCFGFIEYIRAH